jgi:lipopolysaccharide/colanic/teichoic acid biosynthesis glycosyltransferase
MILSGQKVQRNDSLRRSFSVYLSCKMAAEWLASFLALLLLAPLLAVAAMGVKASSGGPAFYCQVRLGRNGRPYRVYKIRTMVHQAEAKTGAVWAAQDDPRVTPIGRFLRDTHLDELPQLWNILRGEMSLIGPRPERPEIASQLESVLPNYRKRLHVRPGLTGLAQLRLPADSDVSGVRRKLSYDLYYVRRASPMLDVRIAASTGFYLLARFSKAMSEGLVRAPGREAERQRHLGNPALSIELQFPRASISASRRNANGVVEGVKAA